MADESNYYYHIHSKSTDGSSWHIVHTIEDLSEFFRSREGCGGYGIEYTVTRPYGWDEEERKELARLKAKYEPEEPKS